jgi:hypothetical protein
MKYPFTLVLLSLMVSCGSIDDRGLTVIVNIEESGRTTLGAFPGAHRVVPLESEDSILIGGIDYLKVDDERIFLLDHLRNQVLIFAADGKYVSRVGKAGAGPGEIERAKDFSIVDGGVEIFDDLRMKLVRYALNNEFIEEKPVPFFASRYVYLDDETLLFDKRFSIDREDLNYSLLICDTTMNIANKLLPVTKRPEGTLLFTWTPLIGQGGEAYYYRLYEPRIWRIDKKGAGLAFELDFGKRWFNQRLLDQAKGLGTSGLLEKAKKSDNIYFFDFLYNGQTLALIFYYLEKPYVAVNKPGGSKTLVFEANDALPGLARLGYVWREEFIGYFNPYELKIQEVSTGDSEIDLIISESQENSNPVIIFYRL